MIGPRPRVDLNPLILRVVCLLFLPGEMLLGLLDWFLRGVKDKCSQVLRLMHNLAS